jgi:hypothetical protein
MLDPHFTRLIESHRHTAWACHLDDEQLAGVLWALLEFACRSSELTNLLDEHPPHIDPADADFARALALLQRLSELVYPRGSSVPPRILHFGENWRDVVPSRTGLSAARPILGDAFRRQLNLGKYTRWALDITGDRLLDILATAGELAPLTHLITAQLDRRQAEADLRIIYARARTALEIIAEVVHGGRYTLDEVSSRITLAKRKAEKRLHLPGDWWTG